MTNKDVISVVLLAAGCSSRLGMPKQLVKLNGESLIRRQCKLALELTDEVILVVGAKGDLVAAEIADLPVIVVHNSNWPTGMASSIATGVQHVKSGTKAFLLLLVDQWQLTMDDLKRLHHAWRQSPDHIWQCENVGKTIKGPPVIFPSQFYSELEKISGEQGAKSVIKRNAEHVKCIALENAFTDLDTPEHLAYCLAEIAAMNPK